MITMSAPSQTYKNILNSKPLLLDPINNKFPEDIVIKINNIICDEYIKKIYQYLENNFIKNIIEIFLNDKKLSKFIYYFGYQTYYFNYMLSPNFGIYGEILNKLEWGDFEIDVLYENFTGINIDTREPYILNILNDDQIFENQYNNLNNITSYSFDANIYSSKLTINETLWILENYSNYDINILQDNTYIDIDIDDNIYHNIYDYDNEEYANIWNLFNRGFMKLNIFKIIYIFCYNSDFDNTIQKYYNLIGGTGRINFTIDNAKLFHKTCYNIIKFFNKKIKKVADNNIIISYLYAIYASDELVPYFNEEHEQYENKAYDLLKNNGLLNSTEFNLLNILDLLYELYLIN
jgi:hypothetical protein